MIRYPPPHPHFLSSDFGNSRDPAGVELGGHVPRVALRYCQLVSAIGDSNRQHARHTLTITLALAQILMLNPIFSLILQRPLLHFATGNKRTANNVKL